MPQLRGTTCHLLGFLMAAEIRRLRTRPARLRQDENSALKQALLPFQSGGDGFKSYRPEVRALANKLVVAIDRETASKNRWPFVMLNPEQNLIVVDYLAKKSARPIVALRLWATCFNNMLTGSGEIVLTRDELAQGLGVAPRDVSQIMSELVEFGAISRLREPVPGQRGPGRVRYFVNPNVATHLAGKLRDDAQREAPMLRLVEGTAHPSQRRSDDDASA